VIPTGFGTYNATTGQGTNVTKVIVRFLATGNLTVNFTNADPFGNKVGLSDGNFFLSTTAAQIVDGQGKLLDGDRDGVVGGTGMDEFWRLYGGGNGDRSVDGLDPPAFQSGFGAANPDTNTAIWFMDFDMNNVIDTNDATQFNNRFFTHLNP